MVVVPRKFVAGVKSTFVPPTIVAVPLAGLTEMILSVPPGVSTTSLVNGEKVPVVFSVMEFVIGLANGGSLVITVITGGLVLLDGVGSNVGVPTSAILVMLPL